MAACEKCWREASHRSMSSGRPISEHYHKLIAVRQCDPEQQKYGEHLCPGCGNPESQCACCGNCGSPNCGCDHERLHSDPEEYDRTHH